MYICRNWEFFVAFRRKIRGLARFLRKTRDSWRENCEWQGRKKCRGTANNIFFSPLAAERDWMTFSSRITFVLPFISRRFTHTPFRPFYLPSPLPRNSSIFPSMFFRPPVTPFAVRQHPPASLSCSPTKITIDR